MLETLEINTGKHIDASIIWLHGLGADGHDFEPIVAALNLANIRFIFPHAPYRNVTINNGYEMRAWYDLYGMTLDIEQDEVGIRQSQSEIEALISREKSRGIRPERIVLAGFSQGGAIALHTALRHEEPLAGVLALSTYLPLKAALGDEVHIANHTLPIFMAHGSFDSVITTAIAQASLQALVKNGYQPIWHEYPMAHSVCDEEINDIRLFLQSILTI
jgi:phospholipase/carboxylesterase